MKNRLPAPLITLLALFWSAMAMAAPVVKDAWIPEQPPGAMANAVFLVIDNPADHAIALVQADAPGFRAVQLHRSIQQNGQHRMVRLKQIVVPARGKTRLAPGGYHIMLIGPEHRLVAGDTLPLTLRFADGAQLKISVPVRKRRDMASPGRHAH